MACNLPKSFFCMLLVLVLLVAMAATAFALGDPAPYLTWSQFRLAKYGKSGNDVRGLQQFLLMQGYAPGSVDGAFGSNTENAVESYQTYHSLTVDGIVGSQTWSHMYNQLLFYNGEGAEATYCIDNMVYPWNYSLYYPEDRFYHYSTGAWLVNYGNNPNSWVELRQMWAP